MRISKFRSYIAILLFATMLSGCNLIADTLRGTADLLFGEEEQRGGVGTVYQGEADAGNEVSSAINTRATNQELQQETSIATDDNNIFYNSLTEATNDEYVGNDEPDGLNERAFILQGLAVQREGLVQVTASGELGWNQDSSTENDIVRITSPAVLLSFNETGQISAVTAYFADKEYSATNIEATGLVNNGTIVSAGDSYKVDGSNTAEITLNRSDSFFGFNSNYMTHIGWNVVQQRTATTAYNVTGSMIAGIETASIPVNNIYYTSPDTVRNSIKFTGKGHGIYGDFGGSYATKFDFNANIDFASNLITLGSTNTIRCQSGRNSLNCGKSADAKQLDFTTSLGALTYSGNNVFGVVGTEELLGFIDARFYGVSAREFGGTIILKGRGVEYYYGAFGSQRLGIVRNAAFNNAISSVTPNNPVDSTNLDTPDTPDTPVTENNVSFFKAMDQNFSGLKTLSVYRDDRDIYNRPPDRAWTNNTDKQNIVTVAKTNSYSTALLFGGDGLLSEVTLNLGDGNTNISGLNQNYTVTVQTNADGIFSGSGETQGVSAKYRCR